VTLHTYKQQHTHHHNFSFIMDAAASIIAIIENYVQEPLPAALIAVGGLVILKFALGVSI
jgi:hypothetical protein